MHHRSNWHAQLTGIFSHSLAPPAVVPLAFLWALCVLLGAPPAHGDDRPHWVPAGTVPEQLERNVVQQRTFLQNTRREAQAMGLQWIEEDMNRFALAEMRIAAAPLLIDMLEREFRILTVSPQYSVDQATRIRVLSMLARMGGDASRERLRESTLNDRDNAVRAAAAHLLAEVPGSDPEGDLHAISRALHAAVRAGGREDDVRRLVGAAWQASSRVWSIDDPVLLDALVRIHSGPYSRSLRDAVFFMLESFARM